VDTVTWKEQRKASYVLEVKAFDTIAGVDPKIEAYVEGYRTDRNYKAVISINDNVTETVHATKNTVKGEEAFTADWLRLCLLSSLLRGFRSVTISTLTAAHILI
ncbi:MAG: hypothetical protein K2H23_04860, partial [Oscillospiraceae bacterium]|nr:hypothetical protein [Oscillospiraceae bacterium]